MVYGNAGTINSGEIESVIMRALNLQFDVILINDRFGRSGTLQSVSRSARTVILIKGPHRRLEGVLQNCVNFEAR